jgi:8-oxo-dGTP pyrophosphatase MutT (NUDIX family)
MEHFNDFITGLKERMTGPLPGMNAQLKMASVRRIIENGKIRVTADAKKGGVLVLFYPVDGKASLVFMKRTEYPGVHSGQVSFPGGAWEPGDVNLAATALREAEEEIGADQKTIEPIGMLSDLFIPPSNFLVSPVVAFTKKRPDFRPDPVEVAKIIEVPFEHFLLAETRQIREITVFPGEKLEAPCFYADDEVIWGATAMILNELIELISRET